MKYDALRDPDPEEWVELDESERHVIVEQYHQRIGFKAPSLLAQSIIHTVIENQIAAGDEHPARKVLERLMREGLDRHEAIHAMGSVVSGYLYQVLKGEIAEGVDANAGYNRRLEALTAESWRKSGK